MSTTTQIWRPYCQMKTAPPPLPVIGAAGSRLHLADGRRLIDALASWWSMAHGYNHPAIVEAIQHQAAKLPHVMFGGLTHEPAERLAERLIAIAPGELNHVFYADSGSVAVEVAMKMAIGYQRRIGRQNRDRFLAFDNAYHGDTTGAMSLCDPDRSMHAAYAGGLIRQHHASLPVDQTTSKRLEDTLGRHADRLAGVFIEPLVQGAGGMRFHDEATVRRVRRLCDQHGVLMIADEIATGFYRTGTRLAIDACSVVPDILCLGKALTGGAMTMAVAIASTKVFDAFWSDQPGDALMHGPTFMANPLACAAALASIELFETSNPVDRVCQIERTLTDGLEPLRGVPGVLDVRVRGATGVVQLQSMPDVADLRERFVEAGVWLRPFGDCVYTTPPLNIDAADLRRIIDAVRAIVMDQDANDATVARSESCRPAKHDSDRATVESCNSLEPPLKF